MFPLVILVGLIGIGAYLAKPRQTVTAAPPGSPQERAQNVLPMNFEAWVRTASPRQVDAIRMIVQYQLRELARLTDDAGANALYLTIDGQNTIPFRYALAEAIVSHYPPSAGDLEFLGFSNRQQYINWLTDDVSTGDPKATRPTGVANPDGTQSTIPYSAAADFFRRVDTMYRDRFGLAPGPRV